MMDSVPLSFSSEFGQAESWTQKLKAEDQSMATILLDG
jgi:hypothetical protein